MKKVLFVVLALGLLIGLAGCDTIIGFFGGIFGNGNLSVRPNPIVSTDVNGFVDGVEFEIVRTEGKTDQVWFELIWRETDTATDHRPFFAAEVEVGGDDSTNVTVTRSMFNEWIDVRSEPVPLGFGSLEVVVDPYEDVRETDEDDNDLQLGGGVIVSSDFYEPNETINAGREILLNESKTVSYYPAGDVDCFDFYCEAGTSYSVTTGTASFPSQIDGKLMELYDGNGTLMVPPAYNYGKQGDIWPYINFVCPANGMYKVRLVATDPDAIGAYKITFNEYIP